MLGVFVQSVQMKSLDETVSASTNAVEFFNDMQRRYFARLFEQTKDRIAGPRGAAEFASTNVNTLCSRLRRLGLERCS